MMKERIGLRVVLKSRLLKTIPDFLMEKGRFPQSRSANQTFQKIGINEFKQWSRCVREKE